MTLDGEPGAFDVPTKVDPGGHVVDVHGTGVPPVHMSVQVGEGETISVPIVLGASPPAGPAGPAAPAVPSSADGLPVGPILLGATGVAAGVTGVVVRAVAQHSYDSVGDQCPDMTCRTSELRDTGNSARSRMVTGTVIAGAGIVTLAAAGVWWWLDRAPRTDARVRASVGPSGVALLGWF
jgi:hypothetical protein